MSVWPWTRKACLGTAYILLHVSTSKRGSWALGIVKTEQTYPDLMCSCQECTVHRKLVPDQQCFSACTDNAQTLRFHSFWKELSLKMCFWTEIQECPCSSCIWKIEELEVMGVKAIAVEVIYRPMTVMKYVNDQILMLGLSACASWKVYWSSSCPRCRIMATNNRL